jgi:hypothetical protein
MPEAAPKGFGARVKGASASSSKAPKSKLTDKQAHDKIQESLTGTTQLAASYFLIANDAYCYKVMDEIGPKWAAMSADMADQSEALKSLLLKFSEANVLISFIVMTGVMVCPILAHHGILPERMMALPMVFNMMSEEDIEGVMQAMADAQEQEQGSTEEPVTA